MEKGVSIVICCYNSAKVIPKTLEHISRQKVHENISWEVVLVDNGSTDGTAKKAERIWNNTLCETPLRLITQSKPGILNARIKGIKAARFEYIIFCDDDNWLNADYVETTYKVMKSNPQIGILGGRGKPVFEKRRPSWFTKYQMPYACGPQGEQTGEITKARHFVYGAGSVYRKSVFLNLIPFMVMPGETHEGARCGEDVLFGLAHVIAGYKIFYDERLTFWHYISKERSTFRYLFKIKWYHGIEHVYLGPFIDHINEREPVKKKFKYVQIKLMHILSAIKNNFLNLFKKKELLHITLAITRNVSSIITMIAFERSYKIYADEVNELIYRIKQKH